MKRCLQLVLIGMAVAWASGPKALGVGVTPTKEEMLTRQAWLKQHLLECRLKPGQPPNVTFPPQRPEPGLDVIANNDTVLLNSRGAHPIKIGDKEFTRGLYCHAVSRVDVHLPGPGRTFTAVVGLDHNDDTARGKGSVIFSVTVNDKVAFRSDVMRFGTPAREVSVDLGGADSFTLEIGDAGDGIGWDQSDWADAKVTLADGRELWLGDMSLRDHRAPPGGAPVVRTSELPFSFVYGGVSSDVLLASCRKTTTTKKLDAFRREHTFRWTDPKTGLEARCVAIEYADFPAVEWTLYFKNTGKADSPILENVQALDTRFERGAEGEFVLHGNKGDWCTPESYEPVTFPLAPQSNKRFAPDGGRPTNGPNGWPYYNLQMPGGGLLMAIGWPGQWASSFTRDEKNGLRIFAGQELTYLYLKPGEEIRSPLIALMFWQGVDIQVHCLPAARSLIPMMYWQGADFVRAQNLWRRWFMAHNIPRVNGQPPATMLQMQCYRSFDKGGEQDLFDTVEEFTKADIPVDLCWRDAGWYPCGGQWPMTGTWEIDATRYPKGFRPFTDWLHKQGKKFILWCEPERVGDKESWLAKNHPAWLLGGNLLNLGNPDAWQWLVNHIDKLIKEQGLDWYRQDFNMDPLGNWRGNDAPNRRGMTEIKHVMGYLAFWDELLRRNPKLRIDSCASGGRRNDLETLRRAVPLLRSDYQFGHEATMPNQGHTYGISSWIPYYGSGCTFTDPYSFRSYFMPCSGYGGHDANTKRAYEEAQKVIPYMLGDFYPLSPYSIRSEDWIAWQFDRPELRGGFVQAFRRDKNEEATGLFHLGGLVPSAKYEVTNLDGGEPQTRTGRQLMEQGLTVGIKTKPGSALFVYKQVK